ncbi:MAG: hypothetical protein QXO69_02610 [archaeon]
MKKAFFLLSILMLSSVVLSVGSEAKLVIRNSATIPSSLSSGNKDVILQFDIYHTGTRTYKDISITGNFNPPFLSVRESTLIPAMDPGDVYTVTLKFDVGEADPGVYTVPITIYYTDTETNGGVTITRNVYLQVSNELMLELRAIKAENVFVGEAFTIGFDFENTGQLPASSIQSTVMLTNSSAVSFIPSAKKTDFISPGETKTVMFSGVVSGKAAHGAYPGMITISYGSKTLTNYFVLDVLGKPSIQVVGVTTDEEPNPGKKVMLSVQLENTGTGDAKSTKVTLKPDDSIAGVFSSYVGTIEPDDTSSAVFDIIMSKVGVNRIPILIECIDETGQKRLIESSIEVYNQQGPSNSAVYVVGVVLVAAVLYFVYSRREKHKQGKIV